MKLKVFLVLATGMMFGIAFAAISIDPIARTFSKTGGAATVLTSSSGTWTASTVLDWILIKPRTSGDAGGSCVYVVSKNMSTDTRVGQVVIDGNVHTVAQLVAIADSGYVFSSWGGDVFGVATNLTVTMDRTKVATATFIPESAAQQIAKDRGSQDEGLYTRDQIHALEVGSLLFDVDAASGTARVGVKLMKSSNLSDPNGWVLVKITQENLDVGNDGSVGLNVRRSGDTKFYKIVIPENKRCV